MKKQLILILLLIVMGLTTVHAQRKTTPPPEQKSGVQDVTSVVPEMLPRAIRDSIEKHPTDSQAEITSANEMSKDGDLVYEVNFLKDDKTWSKKYDVQGRHIDNSIRREEFSF